MAQTPEQITELQQQVAKVRVKNAKATNPQPTPATTPAVQPQTVATAVSQQNPQQITSP